MSTVLDSIDSLFKSFGWNAGTQGNCKYYYRLYYELERFEITPGVFNYKVSIPLRETNYSVHLKETDLYDYLYDRVFEYQRSLYY